MQASDELLSARGSGRAPERAAATAIIQLDAEGRERGRWSYAALDERVDAAAARLAAIAAPGERAILSASAEPALLIALLACVRVGVAAVPARLCGSNPRLAERVQASLLVAPSQRDGSAPLLRSFAARCEGLEIVTLDDSPAPTKGGPAPSFDDDDLALLFDDSDGPRASVVGLSHAQLARQLGQLAATVRLSPADVFVSWLPPGRALGRALGLLASVHALASGATLVTLPTGAVLRDPGLWLRAMTQQRATMSAAPGFMLERCASFFDVPQDLDLSTLRSLLSAPQALTSLAWPGQARAFGARFARRGLRPAALRPVYVPSVCAALVCAPASGPPPLLRVDRQGLAEGVLRQTTSGGVELVALGRPVPGVDLAIVDPRTRSPCAAGEIGEIELCGASLGAAGERLRSGDLGALVDGELVLCGQLPARRDDPSLAEFVVG